MAHRSLEGRQGQAGRGGGCPWKHLEWPAEAGRPWRLREQDLQGPVSFIMVPDEQRLVPKRIERDAGGVLPHAGAEVRDLP